MKMHQTLITAAIPQSPVTYITLNAVEFSNENSSSATYACSNISGIAHNVVPAPCPQLLNFSMLV